MIFLAAGSISRATSSEVAPVPLPNDAFLDGGIAGVVDAVATPPATEVAN